MHCEVTFQCCQTASTAADSRLSEVSPSLPLDAPLRSPAASRASTTSVLWGIAVATAMHADAAWEGVQSALCPVRKVLRDSPLWA